MSRGIRRDITKTNLQVRGVYITLERQIKYGRTKGCAACFGDAKVHSPECRARFQDIVDNEAAQTAAASASEPNVEMREQAAGGPAPEDANMEPAESSAAQPTSSVVRTLEAEDDTSAKRQKLMAGMPILHETDVDVKMDAHKLVVLAAMPDDQGKWPQRVIDWDKKYYGAKSGTLLDTQKVYEGRLRELANIEKLEVAEPIQLLEPRVKSLEIVYGKWLDDVKGTPEDPDAVRSRLVATQVNTYASEDVTQATPPIKASRIIVSQAATKINAKGQHDCLIARHDIRVAFLHAKGSGRVVIIPPKGSAPPGIGWECVKAWYGTREASKCWRNEVTDTLIKEGCKAVVVAPMMFVSENHGYVTVCHGDDFLSCGSAAALDVVDRVLAAHFDTKILPRIGPTACGGEVTEGKHLGRTIRWSPQGSEWESNSKHVEDMVELCGLKLGPKGSTDADYEGDGKRM